jgi:hypothetical protein
MESKNARKKNKKVHTRFKQKINPIFRIGQKQKGGITMRYINKERLIKTFVDLASIPSSSGHEENVSQVLMEKLKLLGLVVQKDAYGNVIAKLSREGESIILCAHMDTVAVGKDVIKVVVDEDNGMTVRPFLAPTTKMRSPLYSKCWR